MPNNLSSSKKPTRKVRRSPPQIPQESNSGIALSAASDRSVLRHPLVVAIVSGLVLTTLTGAAWVFTNIFTRLGALETKVGELKQAIADGGTHEIVSQLKKANSPLVVAAQMSLISAQVNASVADGKKPNQTKIDTLAPAVVQAAKKFPDVPETWSAVSTLVSYRTSTLEFPDNEKMNSLPDCDVDKPKTLFYPEDLGFPRTPVIGNIGYLFQNCKLYLDRLPGHRKAFNVLPNPSSPIPDLRRGGPAVMGVFAYAINVVIVWRGTLSDTDILTLTTRNCKFEFAVHRVPSPQGQNLLLEALENPQPGSGIFTLKSRASS